MCLLMNVGDGGASSAGQDPDISPEARIAAQNVPPAGHTWLNSWALLHLRLALRGPGLVGLSPVLLCCRPSCSRLPPQDHSFTSSEAASIDVLPGPQGRPTTSPVER